MLTGYADILRAPGAARLVACSLAGRLSSAILGLPLILLGADATGSYAGGGAATAAFGFGVAAAAPFRGRLIDRHGARRSLPPLLAVHATALVLVAATGAAGWGAGVIALALLTGLSVPSLPAAMRLEWQRLLGPAGVRLERAYAFEATAQVSLFVGGPILAAAGVTAIGSAGTLVLCAALVAAGGLAFAARARRPGTPRTGGGSRIGPIRLPGVRTLVLAVLVADVSLGAVEVGVVAFADERGRPGAAGLLLAGWALASAAGAAAFGSVDWGRRHVGPDRAGPGPKVRELMRPPHRRLAVLMTLSAIGLAPLALAASIPLLALLLLVGGLPYAAQFVTSTVVLDVVAPAEAAAEAYNWLSAANATGVALGSLLAGVLVETAGTGAALAAGAVTLALAATWVVLRRAALGVSA